MLTVGDSGERWDVPHESQGPRLIPPRLYLMGMAAIGGRRRRELRIRMRP